MKNIFTTLMTSAVLLFTLGSGLEAQTIRMQAAVPFAWQVNGQQLNAGDYEITRDANAQVLRIQDKTTQKGTFLIITPASDKNNVARLVFHRYGDRYFLAEVVTPGLSVSKLRISPAEREAMKSNEPSEMSMVVVDVRPVLN
jgi:hypothetical protein